MMVEFPNDSEPIYVFYNMEDYPIPVIADADQTRMTSNNIISAFRQLGSTGTIHMYAFANEVVEPQREISLNFAGLTLMKPEGFEPGEGYSPDYAIFRFLASFRGIEDNARYRPEFRQRPILVVIARERRGSDLGRLLSCLRSRGRRIILLTPPCDYYVFPSVHSVLECGRVLGGQRLVDLPSHEEGYGERIAIQ